MCGIAGVWHLENERAVDSELLHAMTATLRHRGPDDEGYVLLDTKNGRVAARGGRDTMPELRLFPLQSDEPFEGYDLGLGCRRLAVLDPSPAGHQPMAAADETLWIVHNGEIYNYRELSAELRAHGYAFRTGTDTEVLLAAYDAWGEACLERLRGMWAFALWDGRRRRLFCARDRFGMKPFYYFWNGTTFAFASEIKALLLLPALRRVPNEGVIYDYLSYGRSDHTDETFWADIRQLPTAHSLVLDADGGLRSRRYWTLQRESMAGAGDAGTRFAALFDDAMRIHLRSDAPLGFSLSGGLDSSAIVCVAKKLSQNDPAKPQTFSSCYDDARFDERPYIRAVAAHTGAETHATFPTGTKLLQTIDKLLWHHDEPFGGLSIFAQWCVMERAASRGITVLLDGQGGDEILAGYGSSFDYFWGGLLRQGRWRTLGREWQAYRRTHGGGLPDLVLRTLRPFAPSGVQRMMRRIRRGSDVGLARDFERAHRRRVHEFVHRGPDPLGGYLSDLFVHSLPMLLRFADRNSMAHSIETRMPFLDHRLVEFAFTVPPTAKIRRGLTKHLLRTALHGVLPDAVRTRADKMGFVAPEQVWMTEELDPLVRDVVASRTFRQRPYFDVARIDGVFARNEHRSRATARAAWRWINLELWLRRTAD